MTVAKNLVKLREKHDITQEKLADIAGVTPTAVSRWESGNIDPRLQNLQKIADYFNISVDDLRSESHGLAAKQRGTFIAPVISKATAPVLGYAPAGDPYEAQEMYGEDHWVDEDVIAAHPQAWYLIADGDSMDKLFVSGSYILIDPTIEPRDGDAVAVIVNGDQATIKRIFFAGDVVVLQPDSTNPKHKARPIDVSDEHAPPVRILGVCVWHVPPVNKGYKA